MEAEPNLRIGFFQEINVYREGSVLYNVLSWWISWHWQVA